MPSSRTSKNVRNGYYLRKHSHSLCRNGFEFDNYQLSGGFQTGELLVCGDNLQALQLMQNHSAIANKIRLVYIDPPFGTRQVFNVSSERMATISRGNGGEIAYKDNLSGETYLKFLKKRLQAIRDVMAIDGSIYVHIDCKVGHYVKCLMDEVFGVRNFVNDITRIKCNPKNFNRQGYGNVKDMILFYRKGKSAVWNNLRQPIEIPLDDNRFCFLEEDGRRYTTTPLHAPGETVSGATGKPWRGLRPPPGRHWRYPPNVLEELNKKGLIQWSSTGNPRKKIYADEVMQMGVKIQDVWFFKDPQNPKYPTEKNTNLLKLIVSNSSNPGDIVLDAFCGSGTALVTAKEMGRRWIGIDESMVAIAVCKKRLPDCNFVMIESDKKEIVHCE